jgi:hypothetical protein
MTEFVEVVLGFPTILFTGLLALVVIYWLLVILGTLDVDVFGGAADAGEIAGGDATPDANHWGASSFAHTIGLGGVPLTISGSFVILFAWVFCALGVQFLTSLSLDGAADLGARAGTGLVALGAAVAAASIVVRPLRRFFVAHTATAHRQLIGKVCTITTLRVDDGFGQAEVRDGGAGLLIQVRCAEPNDMSRGVQALIYDYDAAGGIFHVERFDDGAVNGPAGVAQQKE